MTSKADTEFNAEELFGWVEAQVALGARRPGSAAGRANEEMLEGMLRSFGLEAVRSEPIPITVWEATDSCLEVSQPGGPFEELEAFPIPYVAFTGDSGVEGPLVYADRRTLRHGAALDSWRGAVVVTEIGFPPLPLGLLLRLAAGLYDPHNTASAVSHPATWVRLGWHLYAEARKAGAVGFLGVLSEQPGGTSRMYAPYGFKEKDILDKPLPGFWVGREAGQELISRARQGGVRARLRIKGVREPGFTHNVVGEIPPRSAFAGGQGREGGREVGDRSIEGAEEVVVLSCHHDSPFTSPVEDASGVAVVLGLAKHFARAPLANRRILVLLTAGHFYGSIGTRTFIREHPEIVRQVAAEISIEHIGKEATEDASGRLVPTGLPEATGIFVPFSGAVRDTVLSAVRKNDLHRSVLLYAEGPLGPYPPTDGGDWWEAGVPVINHISNPVYLLTDDDAFCWVDKERLPVVAATFAEILEGLDALSRQAIAARDKVASFALMRVLRHLVHAKTTKFGLHPVY